MGGEKLIPGFFIISLLLEFPDIGMLGKGTMSRAGLCWGFFNGRNPNFDTEPHPGGGIWAHGPTIWHFSDMQSQNAPSTSHPFLSVGGRAVGWRAQAWPSCGKKGAQQLELISFSLDHGM